jgi:hypothetical protein
MTGHDRLLICVRILRFTRNAFCAFGVCLTGRQAYARFDNAAVRGNRTGGGGGERCGRFLFEMNTGSASRRGARAQEPRSGARAGEGAHERPRGDAPRRV